MLSLLVGLAGGFLLRPPRQHAPAPLSLASPPRPSPAGPRCSETDDAYAAGGEAVATAAASQAPGRRKVSDSGRPYTVTLNRRPFGLVLGENPAGRGTYISEVLAEGAAAGRKEFAVGDYLVGFSAAGKQVDCAWLPVVSVVAALGEARLPLTLRMRRGGPEPWALDRDGSGLSVEEMVAAAKAKYSRLVDEEKEEALRSAFAEIKEDERRDAAAAAASGGYESATLGSLNALEFNLRAFVQGAKDEFEKVKQYVYNRALLDTRVAQQTAEYLLRRLLLDLGPVLASATRLALGSGGGAAAGDEAPPAPFVTRLGSISKTRSLSAAPAGELESVRAGLEGEAEAERRAFLEERARDEGTRRQAKALLGEALSAVEVWARNAAAEREAEQAGRPPPPRAEPPPDWEALGQRASLLGGAVGEALGRGLATVQADFEAFQELQERGRLPTLLEEIAEMAEPPGRGEALRSFDGQSDETEQRRRRSKRRQSELELKQLKVVAAAGERCERA